MGLPVGLLEQGLRIKNCFLAGSLVTDNHFNKNTWISNKIVFS
jgi:hypothetical protein